MREELRRLRSDNSALYTGSHEQEKLLTQLRTRVAVLEQDLKAKEQVWRGGGDEKEAFQDKWLYWSRA